MMRMKPLNTIGLPDGYFIYEDGRVISTRSGKRKTLSTHIATVGYPSVGLKVNGKTVCFCIHRLLAQCFIPNPHGKPQINHINGDKCDNRIENLEWCTDSENKLHAWKTGLRVTSDRQRAFSQIAARRMILARRSITDDQASKIREALKSGISQRKLSVKMGISRSLIASIDSGRAYNQSSEEILDEIAELSECLKTIESTSTRKYQ